MIKETTKQHVKNLNKELDIAQKIVLPLSGELRNAWANYVNAVQQIYKYKKAQYEVETIDNVSCLTCGHKLTGRDIQ